MTKIILSKKNKEIDLSPYVIKFSTGINNTLEYPLRQSDITLFYKKISDYTDIEYEDILYMYVDVYDNEERTKKIRKVKTDFFKVEVVNSLDFETIVEIGTISADTYGFIPYREYAKWISQEKIDKVKNILSQGKKLRAGVSRELINSELDKIEKIEMTTKKFMFLDI